MLRLMWKINKRNGFMNDEEYYIYNYKDYFLKGK